MEHIKGVPDRESAHDHGQKGSDVRDLLDGAGDALCGAVWSHVLRGLRASINDVVLSVQRDGAGTGEAVLYLDPLGV